MIFPPPLMTSEPDSYARLTIIERKPKIISQIIEDNNYPPEIVANLGFLRQEITDQVMQPLHENIPDCEIWNHELARYSGKTWLEVPWYFAETFFYRKVLEAVNYFQPGQWMFWNPFCKQKERQMRNDVSRLADSWERIFQLSPQADFETFIHSALWGNRADLSNFTIEDTDRNGWTTQGERDNILIDDTAKIEALLSSKVERVAFINDNAGADVLFDLALSDFLLTQGWVKQIIFHLKNQPFFVSDAMPEDIHRLISILMEVNNPTAEQNQDVPIDSETQALGKRLLDHFQSESLILKEDPFWTSPFMFRQMPPHLVDELGQSDLVILKGDVNYRRLLDDLHWDHTAKMEDITTYFPVPFATLRTLKGEIMVGLQPGQAASITEVDPTWLINGKRGIIQFIQRSSNHS
jgi:hypothetical protein